MSAYVADLLDLPLDAARRLQKDYYRDHGTTLNGLIALHGIDPESFLDYVHDIDLSALIPDARLNAAAAKLPGRRFVFTNGCAKHALRVLDAAMFDDVARNLVAAHALGMTTVWLNNGSEWSKQGPEYPVAHAHHIDHETADLADFLHTIRI